MRKIFHHRAGLVALLFLLCLPAGHAASVLMISIDGMKPEYVLQADAHGLKIPFLRGMLAEGSYARGVTGVWPTVTYPSHTTLVTGVAPAGHGILANLEFDPLRNFKESWFWYAAQIRVPTLWTAAHTAKITTASVGWPVTVGATDIDYLIPEYWRITAPPDELNPSDRNLIAELSRPLGLLARLKDTAGPYLMANDTSLAGDEIKTRYTLEIIKRYRPGFMTLHLSSLDTTEHFYDAFSAQANQVLESLDAMLSRLAAEARAQDPAALLVVVSDHGFASLTHRVNLNIPFIQSGLIEVSSDPDTKALKISGWKAAPWLASGMAAIMLRDPEDRQTEQKALTLLTGLSADPRNGIDAILNREQLRQRGGFPDASFLVVLKTGYYAGSALSGDFVTEIKGTHGGHGFSPDDPQMRASFLMSGAGVAAHRDLGVIDMRRIAPTVAAALKLSLPATTQRVLPILRN